MRTYRTFSSVFTFGLLSALTLVACGASDGAAPSSTSGPQPAPATTTPAASPTGAPSSTGEGASAAPAGASSARRLVAYWASWTRATLPPSRIPWSKLTHVAHAFVTPTSAGGLDGVDAYVDEELLAQAHAHGVKVLASVGGAGASFAFASDPKKRAVNVAAMAALCGQRGYDGIDLDWEFPTAASVGDWTKLVRETRAALDAIRPGLTLSAALGSGEHLGAELLPQAGVDALDWIGVMTYDFAGPWSGSSGHDAPLRRTPGGEGGSVSESIEALVGARGVTPAKVLVGLPFYGYRFGASSLASTPVSPSAGLDYRDIVAAPASEGWSERWDEAGSVPYRVRAASPGFVSYDDARSIGAKCAYAKGESLGGAIVWHLAGDLLPDGAEPLLDAAQACR